MVIACKLTFEGLMIIFLSLELLLAILESSLCVNWWCYWRGVNFTNNSWMWNWTSKICTMTIDNISKIVYTLLSRIKNQMWFLGELNLGLKDLVNCNKSHIPKHWHKMLVKIKQNSCHIQNCNLEWYQSPNFKNHIRWQTIEDMTKLVAWVYATKAQDLNQKV